MVTVDVYSDLNISNIKTKYKIKYKSSFFVFFYFYVT